MYVRACLLPVLRIRAKCMSCFNTKIKEGKEANILINPVSFDKDLIYRPFSMSFEQ